MKHGTQYGYNVGGCRCSECSHAASEARKRRYWSKPQQYRERARADMQLSRDRGRGRRTEASKALKNQRAKERIATETEVERGLRLRRMGERASAIQAATSAQATIRGPYSEAEVLFMIRNPQLSSKELAFALGRTYGSVKTKRFHAIRPLEGSTHTA